MVNYSKGKIYKIICDETNKTYYGSTTQQLCRRFQHHKTHTNSTVSREMTKPKIYLIEDFPCERKEQLLKRERYFIENNECINKGVPGRTTREYYDANKEQILLQQKQHNQELNNKKNKEYYQRNKNIYNAKFSCECGGKYTHTHKSSHIKTKKHIKYVNSI